MEVPVLWKTSTFNDHMAVQHAARAQLYMFSDNAKGTDFNIIRDLRSRMHYCRWVYFWHGWDKYETNSGD